MQGLGLLQAKPLLFEAYRHQNIKHNCGNIPMPISFFTQNTQKITSKQQIALPLLTFKQQPTQ